MRTHVYYEERELSIQRTQLKKTQFKSHVTYPTLSFPSYPTILFSGWSIMRNVPFLA